MAPSKITYFWTSLSSWAGVFLILFCVYCFFSRRKAYRVIYSPNLLNGGRELPDDWERSWRPWSWISEPLRTREPELVAIAGLDAAIYLRLFNTALIVIFYSMIVCVPLLIPLALSDKNDKMLATNPNYDFRYSRLDELTISNIQSKSNKLWACIGAMYWMSFVTYWALNRSYKYVVKLRTATEADDKAKPEHFACLVRDIPKLRKSERRSAARSEQVDNFFRERHPDTFEKSLIVTKFKKASKLWTELETAKSNLAHAEKVFNSSKTKEDPEGKRPTHRTGNFGLCGIKVDSINYWKEKIKDLSSVLQQEQTRTEADKQQGAAVVFFNSRRAAVEASQEKHSPIADRWQVLPAPEPRALIWKNIHIRFYSRLVRESIVYTVVLLLVMVYMIPIVFISALVSLSNLTKVLPFLNSIVDHDSLLIFINGFIPQLALIIIFYYLPDVLRFLSKKEGIVSKAHLDRAASGKMYYFVLVNIIIGCTGFGAVLQITNSLKRLTDVGRYTFSKMIDLFGASLPHMGTYFILYVATRIFGGYGLELSRFSSLCFYIGKKTFLRKTEDEIDSAPGPILYYRNIPYDLLVMTITLTYAVIAPLILPFAFAYFLVGWFVRRYQALRVYVPDYESGGRFWPHIHNRFLVSLFVAQITAIAYFGFKKFIFALFLVPLPFITLLFARITHLVYYSSFNYVSGAAFSYEDEEMPLLHNLVDSFTPPCLVDPTKSEDDKIDDSKYEDAESSISSRTPSVVTSPLERRRSQSTLRTLPKTAA